MDSGSAEGTLWFSMTISSGPASESPSDISQALDDTSLMNIQNINQKMQNQRNDIITANCQLFTLLTNRIFHKIRYKKVRMVHCLQGSYRQDCVNSRTFQGLLKDFPTFFKD